MKDNLLAEDFISGVNTRVIRRNRMLARILLVVVIIYSVIDAYLLFSRTSAKSFTELALVDLVPLQFLLASLGSTIFIFIAYKRLTAALEVASPEAFNESFKLFYSANMITVVTSFLQLVALIWTAITYRGLY